MADNNTVLLLKASKDNSQSDLYVEVSVISVNNKKVSKANKSRPLLRYSIRQ